MFNLQAPNLADNISLLWNPLEPGVLSLWICLTLHNYHQDRSVLGSVLGTFSKPCRDYCPVWVKKGKWLPPVPSGTDKVGVWYSASCRISKKMKVVGDDSFSDVCNSSLGFCSFPVLLFLHEEYPWRIPMKQMHFSLLTFNSRVEHFWPFGYLICMLFHWILCAPSWRRMEMMQSRLPSVFKYLFLW